MELKINPVFRDLIPALSADERSDLEKSLIANGCLDSIKIWNKTIIDGHNRYELCTKHKIQFETLNLDFVSESEAKIWIIQNQFGRRNISIGTRALLALELEPLIAEQARESFEANSGRPPIKPLLNSTRVLPTVNTRREVAKIAGVSESTIREAKAVKESGNQEVLSKMKSGEISTHKAYTEVMPKKETKICSMCFVEKPIGEFYPSKNYCRACAEARRAVNNHLKEVDCSGLLQRFEKGEALPQKQSNNSSILELTAITNEFRAKLNKYALMPKLFDGIQDSNAIQESLIKAMSEIQTILNNINGGKNK